MAKGRYPTAAEMKALEARGKAFQEACCARSLSYDPKRDAFVLRMYSGVIVNVPRKWIKELRVTSPEQRKRVTLTGAGEAISLRELDIDVSVPGALRRALGLDWFERGGRARTPAKAAAARRNGLKGGRPSKSLTV
jgi:hypothetical protein